MIGALLWLLLTMVAFDAQTWAYDVFQSPYLYELGFYGLYPTVSFKSFGLTPPLLNFAQWDEQKCSDGYYLIAQKGKLVSTPGPAIFDARGQLVWTDDSYGVVFNFQIQPYKGEDYLTFWASPEGSSNGYGRGSYYMLDSSYELFRKFEPVGQGLRGDLHEFRITKRGTALVTVYNPVPANLTSIGGPEEGWALDSLFQEIDIETGALVFEWSAIEHVALTDAVRYFAGKDDGRTPETAFDFFHINSVDTDGDEEGANYVVSARHTSAILCVSARDGEVLWTLGGVSNDFEDLSDGLATDFMYQHHAQLHDNSTLSLFDNAAAERAGRGSRHAYSRGMLVQLDTAARTATLLRTFGDDNSGNGNGRPPPPRRRADSQGSMQVVAGDRVVLGYGWLPFVTEFALDDGAVLCDVELAPWVAARWGLVNSYRAFKAPAWAGRPRDPPAVHVSPADARVFVSWNGATGVARWVLQGAAWADVPRPPRRHYRRGFVADVDTEAETGFTDLDDVARETFETTFDILPDMPRYLRVAAVDGQGNVLAHTQIVDRHVGTAAAAGDWVHDVLVWAAILSAAAAAVLLGARKRGRRALLGNSTRWRDWLARATGGICERYPSMWWRWRDRDGAKAHELQSIYHD